MKGGRCGCERGPRGLLTVAFWDASAIIPLCCSQPATAQGRRLQRELKRMVVWWGTPIEARSALARLVRDGHLTADGAGRGRDETARPASCRVGRDPADRESTVSSPRPCQTATASAPPMRLNSRRLWCGAGNAPNSGRWSVSMSVSERRRPPSGSPFARNPRHRRPSCRSTAVTWSPYTVMAYRQPVGSEILKRR